MVGDLVNLLLTGVVQGKKEISLLMKCYGLCLGCKLDKY